MATKFGRVYSLQVEALAGGTITIEPPFTVEFDISRDSFNGANNAIFRVYNLGAEKRNQIRMDQWDYGNRRKILFNAGYGENLSTAFKGTFYRAFSVREGNNWITQIECFDGGFAYANAYTSQNFPANTSQQTILGTFVDSLKQYGVDAGAIGTTPGTIGRAEAYSGPTVGILQEITGNSFFIDNEKANILYDSQAIAGRLRLIDAGSGLLNTPVREQNYVNFEMLFEPELFVGQTVQLSSQTDQSFNTQYVVKSLKHKGVISDAVCGSAITNVGAIPGTFFPIQSRTN